MSVKHRELPFPLLMAGAVLAGDMRLTLVAILVAIVIIDAVLSHKTGTRILFGRRSDRRADEGPSAPGRHSATRDKRRPGSESDKGGP